MGKLYTHVDDTERRLVKNMLAAGIPWSQVQRVTGRSSATIHAILKPRLRSCMKGAPEKLSAHDVAKSRRGDDKESRCPEGDHVTNDIAEGRL